MRFRFWHFWMALILVGLLVTENSRGAELWVKCKSLNNGTVNLFKGNQCPRNWVFIQYVYL